MEHHRGVISAWVKPAFIAGVSLFFLVFGIEVLMFAYRIHNPLEFIMLFFSSNLIILISAVGLLWPLMQLYRRFRASTDQEKDGKGHLSHE